MTDVNREDVERILDDIDANGLDEFMARYPQFGMPRQFWFRSESRIGEYPTKPVTAAALGWPDINGGYSTHNSACNILERAGYTIVDKLLTSNAIASAGAIAELDNRIATLSDTERDAIIRQRVGQDVFRKRLDVVWGGTCPMTGLSDRGLLRASHIKSWKECQSDSERLDKHNGILLSALWDAAFDRGLVSFSDEGQPLSSSALTAAARVVLAFDDTIKVNFVSQHLPWLAWHREHHGFEEVW